MDLLWFGLLVIGVALLGMLAGGGRSREDIRARRRWDAAFEHDSRRLSRTDATGMLLSRSCGASAPSGLDDALAAARCSSGPTRRVASLELKV